MGGWISVFDSQIEGNTIDFFKNTKYFFSASPLVRKWSDQAEKKVDEKPVDVDVDIDMTGEDKELAEAMNEEIAWAMQQKHEAQVAAGNL